eukprot:Rhum_TRINITY_DN14693_c0_g1::Rhum_TRINITY_DN14693_c0_g1_i3::g.107864::m.107864
MAARGILLATLAAAAVVATPGPLPLHDLTRITFMACHPSYANGEYKLSLNVSEYSVSNFQAMHSCARKVGGLNGKPHELVITLGLDIKLWTQMSNDMDKFGPVAVKFLQDNDLDGMNFDWETNVDTTTYMRLLKGLRKAFDSAVPKKKFLITVAPGWPRYPWDASANGVVDAFDMMSYADNLEDCKSRVDLFVNTYKIPKSTLLCGAECEPHADGTLPGWNTDADLIAKTQYTAATGLQGMFSFRLDNDHGPWPKTPAEPTYHGAEVIAKTALNATKGNLGGFVVNTYVRFAHQYFPSQLKCVA